jgi:hypothetical protein
MKKNAKVIKMFELRHARMVVEQLHEKLKEGYACEGNGLIDVINAMMDMLHDVITTAEKHKVTVDGAKVIEPTRS